MARGLMLFNAILTLPVGVIALVAPVAFFAPFGVQLDAQGALIARGYASTLVGYGLLLLLLRGTTDTRVIRPVLLSLVCFNAIEATIQGMAGVHGVAKPAIFGNVVIHAFTALLSLWTWTRVRAEAGR